MTLLAVIAVGLGSAAQADDGVRALTRERPVPRRMNIAALAALGYPAHFPVALLATLAVGTLASTLLAGRPSDRSVRMLTLLLAATGSVLAVTRGLTASA